MHFLIVLLLDLDNLGYFIIRFTLKNLFVMIYLILEKAAINLGNNP